MGRSNRWMGASLAMLMLAGTVTPALAKEGKKHWWSGEPAREAEPFRWSGRMAEGATLEIHGINGDVHAVLASGDQAGVVAVRRGRKDDPEDVKIEVIERGETVIVCARYPRPSGGLNDCSGNQNVQDCDVSVQFTVQVPANVTFVPRIVNGSIDATGLQGEVEANTVNGSITIATTAIAGAKTVNGSIDARIGLPQDDDLLEFETVNGRIALEVPRDLDADLDARASNGSIRSDLPVTTRSSSDRRRRLVGRIGDGGTRLHMSTVNGSIELASY